MSKVLKNYLKFFNLFKNPSTTENSHHAETSQSTRNASKGAGCNNTSPKPEETSEQTTV